MELRRRLNFSDATLLVVGNVIGAGIFTTSEFFASELTQPFLFICFYIFIAGQIAWARPSTSITGVLIMLSGLPFYMVWSKINRPKRDAGKHV